MHRTAHLLVVVVATCAIGLSFVAKAYASPSLRETFRSTVGFQVVQGAPSTVSTASESFDGYYYLGLLESRSDRIFLPVSIDPPPENKLRLSLFYFATLDALNETALEVGFHTTSAATPGSQFDELLFSVSLDRTTSYGNSVLFSSISGLPSVLQNEWVELAVEYTISGEADVYLNGAFVMSAGAPGSPPQCPSNCSLKGISVGYAAPTAAPTTTGAGPAPAPAPVPAPRWTHRVDTLFLGSPFITKLFPGDPVFEWSTDNKSPGKAVRLGGHPSDLSHDETRVPVGSSFAFPVDHLKPTGIEFPFRYNALVTSDLGRGQGLRVSVDSTAGPLLEVDILSRFALINDPRNLSLAGPQEARLRLFEGSEPGDLQFDTPDHLVRIVFDWDASTFDVIVNGLEVLSQALPLTPGAMEAITRVTLAPTPSSSDAVFVWRFLMGAACTTQQWPAYEVGGESLDVMDIGGLTCKGTSVRSDCDYAWCGDGFYRRTPTCTDSYGVPYWSGNCSPTQCWSGDLHTIGGSYEWDYDCTFVACVAELNCAAGYVPSPETPSRVVCTGISGSVADWVPSPKGACQRDGARCDAFDVANTEHDCAGNGPDEPCMYTCAQGFHFEPMDSGDEVTVDPYVGIEAVCNATGQWRALSKGWVSPEWPPLRCVPWLREPTADLPPYDAAIRFGGVEPSPPTEMPQTTTPAPTTASPPKTTAGPAMLLRADDGSGSQEARKAIDDPIHLFRHRGSLILDTDLIFEGQFLTETLREIQLSLAQVELRVARLRGGGVTEV